MCASKRSNFKIVAETLSDSDSELVYKYNRLQSDINGTKEALDSRLQHADKYDYLNTAIARLKYGFVKEECNALFNEIGRRGLRVN